MSQSADELRDMGSAPLVFKPVYHSFIPFGLLSHLEWMRLLSDQALSLKHHTDKMTSKLNFLILIMMVTGNCMFWKAYVSQSTCACKECSPSNDLWFNKRFNKSVQPFLSANMNFSEDAFKWWQRLQNEQGTFDLFKKTVHDLFGMFPPKPDVKQYHPDRCRTCAVVGNSGNLHRSRYGPLIDFYDVVIRMNGAVTQGYEADVGSKTTHRIMYPESSVNLDNSTHLMLVPFKIKDIVWVMKAFSTGYFGKSYAPVLSKIKANKNLVMVLNPDFMMYVHHNWLEKKGGYPSTGFMALILAMHICDEVHVFGYGADSEGNWSHYFEKLQNKKLKTGLHPGNVEYGIIQELAKQRKVTFYKGF
ncbi:CMP-N-acetylneuraminate-beta-galactosamide-alpha-2,3-sialyltransferase 1-like [Trematomus bernacchii]|uniref:CMP-N-acetylneuraminate-beta-galactosamide- alpha-2,3-sialyltransferase 1-like n=1 Tax=Trematomus bernacchii TaxID=40690 RepID=UPI00146E0A29|nr:CMP-N-acetylneuraminate-beta-galactosamide-alpha-2,3-sialyltransferase 1-like [Trematomus bernacchii]